MRTKTNGKRSVIESPSDVASFSLYARWIGTNSLFTNVESKVPTRPPTQQRFLLLHAAACATANPAAIGPSKFEIWAPMGGLRADSRRGAGAAGSAGAPKRPEIRPGRLADSDITNVLTNAPHFSYGTRSGTNCPRQSMSFIRTQSTQSLLFSLYLGTRRSTCK